MTDPLPNLWPGHCFGCSPANPHGLQLQFHRTERGARTQCTLPPHLCGFEGIAHGGVVATLLDEVGAWALMAHAGRLGFTRRMDLRFHRAATIGVPLTAAGTVEACDDREARTRAEIRAADGALVAEATSEWTLMSLAVAARMFKLERSRLELFMAAIHPETGG
jgi:uncharacterized protein (TIGR00369 family)